MARGNRIIVTADPKGNFLEGYIAAGETPKPGTILQIDPTVALKGGRHTWKIYNRDADGNHPLGPFAVLIEDLKQGKTTSDAFVAGTRCQMYCPLPGDELNLLVANIAGTADDHAAGEILMVDDSTGMMIATTGTPESECAVLLEAITDPVADTLSWVMWSGY